MRAQLEVYGSILEGAIDQLTERYDRVFA